VPASLLTQELLCASTKIDTSPVLPGVVCEYTCSTSRVACMLLYTFGANATTDYRESTLPDRHAVREQVLISAFLLESRILQRSNL